MSQRFSAESISNEMILVRTLVIIIVNYVQAHKIRNLQTALMAWNQKLKLVLKRNFACALGSWNIWLIQSTKIWQHLAA